MKRAISILNSPHLRSLSTGDHTPVPLETFYVVQTTAGIIGKRHHRACPPVYEKRQRPQIELLHLQAMGAGGGTYSIWKATTYLEPAEWLYDVIVSDGSLIRIKRRNPRLCANPSGK